MIIRQSLPFRLPNRCRRRPAKIVSCCIPTSGLVHAIQRCLVLPPPLCMHTGQQTRLPVGKEKRVQKYRQQCVPYHCGCFLGRCTQCTLGALRPESHRSRLETNKEGHCSPPKLFGDPRRSSCGLCVPAKCGEMSSLLRLKFCTHYPTLL
jgi:hypothetical protein